MRYLILMMLIVFAGVAMATEQPKYEVIEQNQQFELRAYHPMIVAEAVVAGSMDGASGDGFRTIADYIFGNNTAPNGGSEEISMTAPVTMEAGAANSNLASAASLNSDRGQWRVHFVMPRQFSMDALPKPNNPQVNLREVEATRMAVVRFSGLAGEQKVAAKTQELLKWMEQKGLQTQGQPQLARYDPPWTLPFLRRNEVMVRF